MDSTIRVDFDRSDVVSLVASQLVLAAPAMADPEPYVSLDPTENHGMARVGSILQRWIGTDRAPADLSRDEAIELLEMVIGTCAHAGDRYLAA